MTKTIQPRSVASLRKSGKYLSEKGLLIKTFTITIVCILLAFIAISIYVIYYMKTTSLNPAVNIGINMLKNDMAFFEDKLKTEYGQLKLIDGELIGQEGTSLKNNYKLVDKISSDYDIIAAVFARNGDGYRRISNSIVDNNGKRAVDTFLETDNAAYQHIQDGKSYTGRDVFLGKNYLTEYRPIFSEDGKEVIGILLVGKDMSAIEKSINTNIVKYIKKIAAITVVILLALAAFFGLSFKFKFLSFTADLR